MLNILDTRRPAKSLSLGFGIAEPVPLSTWMSATSGLRSPWRYAAWIRSARCPGVMRTRLRSKGAEGSGSDPLP